MRIPQRRAHRVILGLAVGVVIGFVGVSLSGHGQSGAPPGPGTSSDETSSSASQPTDRYPASEKLAKAAEEYGFASWPGKDGRLRPGVGAGEALRQVLPQLRLAWVRPPASSDGPLPRDVAEVSWSAGTGSRQRPISIRMWVCPSCAEAQEVLLRRVTLTSSALRRKLGSEVGIAIGDMCFPDDLWIVFSRNNIVVDVCDLGGEAIAFGRQFDDALLATPSSDTFEGLDRYRPQIRELRLAEGVSQPLSVGGYDGESQEFPLVVDVVDPEGGPVFLYWQATGHLGAGKSAECRDSEYSVSVTVAPPEKVIQQQTITLTAVNERGMFSRATLPVQVFVSEVKYHTESD